VGSRLMSKAFNRVIYTVVVLLMSVSTVFAAVENVVKKPVSPVSYTHVLSWTLGLIVVLCLFFACVWLMKKMGALPVNTKQSMRVLSGLSLGMREKLVLVQVGEKQLLLAVTPGRVENLLLLEGEDKLFQPLKDEAADDGFSFKLKQFMSQPTHE